MEQKRLEDELGRFADLDSAIVAGRSGSDFLVEFRQQGEKVTLILDSAGGRVIENRQPGRRTHGSFRGLLASEGFGNLRRFADAQRALLSRDAPYLFEPTQQLPVFGILETTIPTEKDSIDLIDRVDRWLVSKDQRGGQRALVIDGPAGIGKTHVIRSLTYRRIMTFGPGSAPLILHVQSRGRKLTTLNDVIAGSLNALRVSLTYEQLPVLVRHGLLDVAIDGFDELADPNGYETAWASLRDFVEDIHGDGTLILAGRDTFIDAAQVRRSLTRLDTSQTATAHLKTLSPGAAKDWLRLNHVDDGIIEELEATGLMDDGSYGLRPFFVLQLKNISEEAHAFSAFLEYPLRSLIEALVGREAHILAGALRSLSISRISERLTVLFREVARDMADGERDWIDEATLTLISDITFGSDVLSEELGMLRHRIQAVAMFETDVTQGRRRFPHSEFQDHFLAEAYLSVLADGEIPKSVRRNILGVDFFETFHDVSAGVAADAVTAFMRQCEKLLLSRSFDDRSRTNIASLTLAALSENTEAIKQIRISSVTLDEACFRGTASKAELFDVTISQLDCRGADLTAVVFERSSVIAVIADELSRLPITFPNPISLVISENGRSKPTRDPKRLEAWLRDHKPRVRKAVGKTESIELLEKLCRVMLRQNWIRSIPEDRAGRMLESPIWPKIQEILIQHDLVRIRDGVAVGGPRSNFLRIRRARELMDPHSANPTIRAVRDAVAKIE